MTEILKDIKREMQEIQDNIGAFHETGLKDDGMMKIKPSITVCVDFDGTMVQHEYPDIGKETEGCVETLKRWVDEYNVGIILDTMRSGDSLDEAVAWCKEKGIKLYGISKDPEQEKWTDSPKAYAPFSIDDRNVGCPLVYGKSRRPYVNWYKIVEIFEPVIKMFAK